MGIASISYDEESKKLIEMRNRGAMMGDPMVREGYVQSTIAESMKQAAGTAAAPWPDLWDWAWGCRAPEDF